MNIGRILLTKKSLLTGRTYSHLSKKKMKKKTKKESERRKLIRKRLSRKKNMVQKLYDTCKEVFVNDGLEPKDIKLTVPSLEFSSRSGTGDEAPLVTYIKLHECNKFSIGIFCLPPCGVIPLHNHPGMTVFCKLLAGTMHATSYDWVQNHQQFNHCEQQSGIRLAKVHFDADITAPCDASVLFPESGGNLHCFKALTHCILLDVLGPPYSESEGRHCTYYQDFTYDCCSGMTEDVKKVKVEEDGTRYAWLEERNEQFVVLGGTYDGPTIKI
ncbi:PREDICTED: plant cysteine oxidase 1-like isoform X3 [Nicotiana attenuata]|uniref:plant cysteine oxidase 1-like isoform X3 n=1 Tax=Nicotiana attenuata TaxID=49451 RepID=UPI000904D56F|nr:PREDICTED: plant cysteine oxidase 1-like isoform X3 [Nicotiana attenuata]